MSRPMINATLFNVGTDNDEYQELRQHMVETLTKDELDQPDHILQQILEDHTMRMFEEFDDDNLQDMYDTLKQDEVDPDGITDMFEPTPVEDKKDE